MDAIENRNLSFGSKAYQIRPSVFEYIRLMINRGTRTVYAITVEESTSYGVVQLSWL